MLNPVFKLGIYGVLSVALIACNSTEDEATKGPLLTETSVADTAVCPAGGSTVVFGYDNNDDDTIDEVIDSTSICNGESAGDLLVEQSFDDSCETGGTSLTFGYDTTGDGSINTIVDTAIICSLNNVLSDIYGSSVLYFDVHDRESDPNQTDNFLEVLANLNDRSIISLTEATADTIVDNLNNGDFDLVIYSEPNLTIPGTHVTALTDWVSAGKSAIMSTYGTSNGVRNIFQSNYLGSNQSIARLTDNVVGLYLTNMPITNTGGWGSFSAQLEPVDSAYSVCSWENGTSCAIVGNDGKTVDLGILVDSLSLEDAKILVPNLIRQVSQ